MTAPEQEPPPDDQQQQDAADQRIADDEAALLPALLVAYAAYRTWRGAHHAVPTGWRQVVIGLGLRGLVGGQLAMTAARALGAQRVDAGRPGDELWTAQESGIRAGVDAGLQVLAGALIWTDHQTPRGQDPVTKDVGGVVPTPDSPPALLAQMVATAVVNAAQVAVAMAANWRTKTWRSRRDNRVRDTHVALNGTSVPIGTVFLSPSGAKLRFPGDPRAPMNEVANCRCRLIMSRR